MNPFQLTIAMQRGCNKSYPCSFVIVNLISRTFFAGPKRRARAWPESEGERQDARPDGSITHIEHGHPGRVILPSMSHPDIHAHDSRKQSQHIIQSHRPPRSQKIVSLSFFPSTVCETTFSSEFSMKNPSPASSSSSTSKNNHLGLQKQQKKLQLQNRKNLLTQFTPVHSNSVESSPKKILSAQKEISALTAHPLTEFVVHCTDLAVCADCVIFEAEVKDSFHCRYCAAAREWRWRSDVSGALVHLASHAIHVVRGGWTLWKWRVRCSCPTDRSTQSVWSEVDTARTLWKWRVWNDVLLALPRNFQRSDVDGCCGSTYLRVVHVLLIFLCIRIGVSLVIFCFGVVRGLHNILENRIRRRFWHTVLKVYSNSDLRSWQVLLGVFFNFRFLAICFESIKREICGRQLWLWTWEFTTLSM